MPARKEIEKSFDELNLIPISEAAKRWFCSVRTIVRLADRGKIHIYGIGYERLCDRDMGDAYVLSTRRKSTAEAKKNKVRRGGPRINQ